MHFLQIFPNIEITFIYLTVQMQYVFIHFENTFEAMQCQMCGKYLRITENHGAFVKTKQKQKKFFFNTFIPPKKPYGSPPSSDL